MRAWAFAHSTVVSAASRSPAEPVAGQAGQEGTSAGDRGDTGRVCGAGRCFFAAGAVAGRGAELRALQVIRPALVEKAMVDRTLWARHPHDRLVSYCEDVVARHGDLSQNL